MFTIALGITLKLAYEPVECRKLSNVDGNIVPSFKSRVVKAYLYVFNVIFWDLQVPAKNNIEYLKNGFHFSALKTWNNIPNSF